MALIDTPWIGSQARKLYLQSGQFSSTLLTSQDVSAIENIANDISWDGTNTPWCGFFDSKLYLQSGQFSSTLKTSWNTTSVHYRGPDGISWDGSNTPWCDATVDKLFIQSGQFSSTLKTSKSTTSVDPTPFGISYDGTNTPWIGDNDDKLYLQSGQFSSTLLTSQSIGSVDNIPTGISYDGSNTLWTGEQADKLYLQSGQFTSTLKTSQSIGGVDNTPRGIETNNMNGRFGIIPTTNVDVPVLVLTMAAQESLLFPGTPTIVALSAELTMGLTQESSVTVVGTANVFPSALSLAFVQEGLTVVAGEDLSISVLPLSLGVAVATATILGDVTLLLPGVPMIILNTALSLHAPEVSVTDDIKIIVTNTRTFAISEYTSMAYNSMAKFNDKYLYAKADGIYEGGGDDDNGADIIASYKTGTFDINATEVQKLRNVWLNFRSDGDIQLFSVGNEINTRWYPFVNSTNGTIHERRQKFERGIKDNHFSFGFSNVAGSSFEIKTAKILTEPIRKRR
jgi:hypothetical protein